MDITSYLLGKNAGGGDPNLQNKSVTITENTTTTINPDSGYDGLNEVEVTTNVSGGGGGVKTIYEINALNESMANDFNNYFANLPNNYKILTTDSVTLYTPGDPTEYKYYLIQKRPSGNYRIVWCKSPRLINTINILPLNISWAIQYLGTPINRYYKININKSDKDFVYYSSEYTTIEECIQKLKSNATTYETVTNFLGYAADTPDIIPYSNVSIYFSNYYDETDEYFVTSSTRISSNENIVGI